MDFEWVAVALGDVTWISIAFALGFAVKLIGLPPLIGFLVAGFILNAMGAVSGDMLAKLADIGITLLLFTIGLKLNPKTLLRTQVWAVTGLHTLVIISLFGMGTFVLSLAGISLFASLRIETCLVLAFALSFSSTVFVVKVLEERGEMASPHGGIAIGILIMQDLLAVGFLAASSGKLPSLWALLLLGLIFIRPLLLRLLNMTGHGELLILYGFFLALGGAELFELLGMKADLGALVFGFIVSQHPKSAEMAKAMLGFKDLFLVGFFLTIGLAGTPTVETLLLAGFLVLAVPLKSALFVWLLTRFKLRARTALMAALNLSNYSEFGLIVIAISVKEQWLSADWLVVMALALSLSFILASPLNARANGIYIRHRDLWRRLQRPGRSPEDKILDPGEASVVIFGMGRVGTGAYDRMQNDHGNDVVGIDFNPESIKLQRASGRRVLFGDPTDADFWDRFPSATGVKLIMLAMPKVTTNLRAIDHLKELGYQGQIVATARYPDEIKILRDAGADAVFNIYAEAGVGFADHAHEQVNRPQSGEILQSAPENSPT